MFTFALRLMDSQNTYYEELRDALELMPQTDRVIDALNRTYRRFLDAHTRQLNISLVGPFAQTDYLLKEHKAPAKLRRAIHDVRVAFHQNRTIDVAYALEALVRFFALIDGTDGPTDLLTIEAQDKTSPNQSEDGGLRNSAPQQKRADNEVVRFLLSTWDERYMYGTIDKQIADICQDANGKNNRTEENGDTMVRVPYGKQYGYLRSMLCANTQLNLIRVRRDGDTLLPELIILEPDYLVNITSIAHCFEVYDESPYVHLLSKIMANTTTEHTILGNFASQLLDEELHESLPYKESVMAFFQHNATSLMTTPLPDDFHARAQEQGRNIHRAIGEVLPTEVGAFRREDVLLEPSFYSEMLGLQGRMDLLQHNMKVLIEQKSGKGAFVPNDTNPDTPRPNEQHYVQMLLYMLLVRYNYPEAYKEGSEGIQAFLLYSKYKNSLVKLDFAPELVQRAIRIRNGIAWMDNQLGSVEASWNWKRLLLPLTPDTLNTKDCTGRLWNDYKRPELAALLAPIHNATPLERAYCLRLLEFVSREHLLKKVGNKTRQNNGFAAAWHDSLAEKRQAGNIYDHLSLQGVSPLTFRFTDTVSNDMANFRVGDIVVLYPYATGTDPDIRYTMVHRASIETITADSISLRLRAEQTDPEVFLRHQDDEWAIEHDHMEASYSSQYNSVYSFLSASKERRDLLLLQREPRCDESNMIRGEYGAFNDMMMKVKQAEDFFLIIGPPGTGKTSFGMLNTLREELLEPDSRILLVSYTNRAVDEICSKLVEEEIDFIRLGSTLSCAPEYQPYLLSQRIAECHGLDTLRSLFIQTRVICATTITATSHLDLLKLCPFSLCVIDEASQILEPHLLGLLSATSNGTNVIRKFVMIGDHKQLPAVVQQSTEESKVVIRPDDQDDDNKLLLEIGLHNCRLSLFERLLMRYRDNESVIYMLTKQGRMHHAIADFPNNAFYNGRLTEVPLPHQLDKAENPVGQASSQPKDKIEELLRSRVAFVDIPKPKSSVSDKVNQPEADLIARLVASIYEKEKECFDTERTIGIIVPYRNQIATVRNTIEHLVGPEVAGITIDTVERYQGSQRRYIIYGFTVQQPYQLDFLTDNTFEEDGRLIDRKLNVAMTRAMEHLYMVGNKKLLERVNVFKELIEAYECTL